MKGTVHRLALILAACGAAPTSSCDSKGLGRVDAAPGTDASSCVYAGTTYAAGEDFTAKDGCNTCSCGASGQVACTTMVCLSPGEAGASGRDASPFNGCAATDEGCVLHSGGVLAVGESYADGCSTYSCMAAGSLMCSADACPAPDASVPAECSIPTTLVFGYYGLEGRDSNVLDMSGTLTITLAVGSCSWTLPPCGTPCAVTARTIAADLADPDVQAGFAASSTPFYGVDSTSADGVDYSIERADGRTIQVGGACCLVSGMPCQPVPTGVRRLVQDLNSVVWAAAADPACKGF